VSEATAEKFDFASIGAYTTAEIKESAFGRFLIVGPPKSGKTSALLTAPKPLLINCDGPNAALGAAHQAKCPDDTPILDAYSIQSWKLAVQAAKKVVAAGVCKTIIVDTVTLLADNILDELKAKKFDGFLLWNEFDSIIRIQLKQLLSLDAHVFLVSHIDSGHEEGAGIMPLFPGSGKRKIAGMVDNWVLMDLMPTRVPQRQFVLSPQENWHGSCRNLNRANVCPATVPDLFAALGIAA
jgi:hypothetical protein